MKEHAILKFYKAKKICNFTQIFLRDIKKSYCHLSFKNANNFICVKMKNPGNLKNDVKEIFLKLSFN